MSEQIIERNGAPAFAAVSMDEWRALLEPLETLHDIADAKSAREGELLPVELVARLASGDSPFRMWRGHRGLTRPARAEQVGGTRQMLSMIENGEATPSADLFARLAAALGCDMDYLHAG